MRIIDTHLHLVYKERFSYPWLKDAPALDRQVTAEDYFARAEKLGIDTALHMEVDVAESDMEAETAFMVGAHDRIAGAIAACRPESPDFPAYLERIAAIPGVRGLRRVLHIVPDEISEAPLFVENIRRLSAHDLTFDLCVSARQLPLAIDLAKKCPDVQFVLDHCGVPDIENDAFSPWAAHVSECARLENVTAKISGVIAYAGADWSTEKLRPYISHVIDAFTFDRVVWGSDFPVCTIHASLEDWVASIKDIVAEATPEEQEKLFSVNATRVYRL
ncbi:amidohydrolase family protein [Martelella mediterranea]|uniref:Putative metal-dependent hydrolase of the TIM-barrel fold protein n=1 Tax=Martelella mediterranea DSM 17316 TaxID=1122214 RepID=A0A1U9Z8K4_9HYPH|nr:amidohydrolase [Martelella mediterranea]AQZ54025.1 putative metal-dependent hydrolase of the TIM-barrel fold protein [Martelella mediterranea DSM 17316]